MDEQNIIQGLECCSKLYACDNCPYRSELRPKPITGPCTQILAHNALILLKKYILQELDIND